MANNVSPQVRGGLVVSVHIQRISTALRGNGNNLQISSFKSVSEGLQSVAHATPQTYRLQPIVV